MVAGISDPYERFARAYHDVTILIEEVVRSTGDFSIPERLAFQKLGGTLKFSEGRATWTEAGSPPFTFGERHVFFLERLKGIGEGTWILSHLRYGRLRVEGGRVWPNAKEEHKQVERMGLQAFIDLIRGF